MSDDNARLKGIDFTGHTRELEVVQVPTDPTVAPDTILLRDRINFRNGEKSILDKLEKQNQTIMMSTFLAEFIEANRNEINEQEREDQ